MASGDPKKTELAAELSRALAASPAYSIEESISTHALHFASTKSENFIVIKEYQGETEDFALNVGDIVEAVEYADPSKISNKNVDLDVGTIEDRLDNSAAKHKLSVRPRRNHLDPRARGVSRSSLHSNASSIFVRTIEGKEGWIPMSFVMQTALSEESSTMTSHHKPEDSKYRREAVIKELVETEEEFGRDLQNVVERYLKPLDNSDVPRFVRDNKDLIFSNLKQIADFHNTSFGRVLIEGVKYYADQPLMLGKTFLRLERDFDKHVAYCRDEPHAQEFLLLNDEVREYFEERSQTLGDDKTVAEHLKLPIQRINDYQLLLKELVKYSTRLGEDCADLQKALELMLSIPHRAADNKFISNIEGYKGNIHKLGRLLTHEWYTVLDKEGKSKERYLFLFKARILVCKVKRISEDRSVFVLKDIIRIPEVEVKDHPEDQRVFELHHPGASGFPITLVAHKDPVKTYWLKEIRQYASDVVALAEHAADDLQLTEEPEIEEEYKVPATPELFHVAAPEDEVQSSPEPVKRIEIPAEKTISFIETPTPLSTTPLVEYPETPDLSSKKSYHKLDLYKRYYQEEEDELEEKIIAEKKKKASHEYQFQRKPDPKRAWPGEPPVPDRKEEETDAKRTRFGAWPGDPQPPLESEDQPNMSRRYSSSRYSASSRHYEEYSSVSSTRNGISAHRESSVSSVGGTRRYSATLGGENIIESSSAYEHTKVTGDSAKDVEITDRSAKLALTSSEPSKPTFSKTIEGSNIEQIRTKKAMIQSIAGETASFECILTSKDDSTKMQWLKDNKPLDDALADRVKIITEDNIFKLKIENVMESDSGIYIARATNDEGGASCTAQLIVEKLTPEEKKARLMANAPIFLVQLKDTELLQSTYLRFMIKVKGRPTPEVKFFKNGKLIDDLSERVKVITEKADKGFYELVIPEVQEEDAGKYSCTATNKFGETSCEATLSLVDEKTMFSGLPEGMAEPGEEPKFVWTRDGVQFDPEERFKVLFKDNEDTLALVFQHVKPEDAGLYTCVAQTSTGNISCSAELTVQGTVNQLIKDPTKPVLASESKASEVTAGGSAMLDMQIKGFPKPDIKWLKDGIELTTGGRIKCLWEDEESLSLVIKSVTSRDAGTYTCTAKNELGEDSTQIELIVKSAPKIIKKLTGVTVLTKETLILEVHIMSSPAPEIKWYKGGKLIEESDRISMVKEGEEVYKLIVKDVQMEDAGSYTVIAKNDINQTSDMCDVKVKYPPRIIKNLKKTEVLEEFDSLTLLIEVDADPKPTVTWFKDEKVLEETEKISITQNNDTYIVKISGLVHTDSASYKVKVENQDGIATDQSDVTVRCKPNFTVSLSDTYAREGASEFEFLCQVDSFQKPTVKWYIGDVEITGEQKQLTPTEEGNIYKLKLKNITTDLAGVYSCKAENECGISECKSNFVVYTKPKFIKKVVEQVKLKEGDALNLKVEVEGSPDPVVTWFKDGKAVSADAHIKITRDSNRKESYSLSVDLVKFSDGGKYEVRAQNDMGGIVGSSKVIILTKSEEVVEEEQKSDVEELKKDQQAQEGPEAPPTIVSSTLQDKEVFETQTCRFEIKTSGIPRPEAKWFKDGEPMKQSEKAKWGNTGDNYYLTINRCEAEDEGIYSVILTSKLGSCTGEGLLTVGPVAGLRKPKFIKPLTDADTLKDGAGTFKAVVSGEPVPDAIWYFDGEELPTETGRNAKWKVESRSEPIQDGLKECTYQLKVNKCDEIDVGKYTIKVINQYGEDQSTADLSLLEAPVIEEFKDLKTPAGEGCSWEAVVKANPKPDIIWTKDDKILNDDEHFGVEEDFKKQSYKLIIKTVEDEDVGTYKVKAVNEYGEASAAAELTTYTEAPAFVNELQDESVRDANDHEVVLRITGFPRPEIRWFKDDKEIKGDNRRIITTEIDGPHVVAKLMIKKYSDNDTGVLQCVATNPYGEIETQGRLTLTKFPPTFSAILPGSLDLDEGDKLELVAAVDGSPVPVVKWLKDGEEIKPDDHVKLEILPSGSMKLTINKVTPTDSGSYKVVASNPNGDRATSCSVAVMPEKKKPYFVKDLENKKLIIGEPLKLEVQVLAIPNPQVQWFKDGQPIRQTAGLNFETQPNGTMGLSIDQVRPENAGTYSVVITNSLGEATSVGVIEVDEKETIPTFIGSLQPMTVVEGFPVKLEIKSIGKPQPIYKWSHNGKQVEPDGQHIKIIDMPDGSQALIIDKATPEDAGEYEVLAINSKGMTPTKGILTVASKTDEESPQEKPEFICPLRELAVDEGELLQLSAPIKGNPVPEVTWTKDGKPLKPSERVLLSCDGKNVTLEINPSTLKDSGSYVCKLKNPLGSDSATAKATVRNKYQPPSFIQKFTDIEQSPNTDAKFCARVTGIPLPEIAWYYNGSPLSDSDKYKIKRDGDACSLFIMNCTLADSGRYKCEAVNKDGKVSCDAKLSVIDRIDKKQKVEPPSFLKRIGDCEVYKGMTAKFTACITGIPEPEFEWFRNDDKLWPTDRILMDHEGSLLRLSIYNVDECDAGVYKLRIFNPHGEDTCKADMMYETLDIRKKHLSDQYLDYEKYRKTGLPLPLAHPPFISRMMDRNLTLSWKPSIPIGPRTPVTYLVEMCELPDGDWFTARSGIRGCICEIRDLVPFHDYKFRIRAENKYGVSDPSPFVQTYRSKLEPEAPTFFPYLAPGVDFRPENSPYFPKDFDIERPPYDNYAQAPRFLRQEHETQYGVKNHNCNLFWFVYGYPKPRMTYYFNDELIESGGRYDQSYTRNGQATLFINKMLDRDAGFYEAVAANEHGEARQRVRLDIAEYPTFIQRPEETFIMLRKSGKIEARVIGVPYPDIKWYRDWKPLAPSTRIHIAFAEPDKSILTIEDAISKDDGLYSISARNVAGCVSSSAMIHIEEDEHEYGYKMYTKKYEVEPRQKPYGDFYDIGDELGRGTQGITYHGVERQTGKHFACKVMNGGSEYKHYMHSELEAYNHLGHRNLLRLHDAFETPRSMTLVIELAGGGELVDTLIRRPYYTEYEISGYIRQILWGLDYMHSHSWAHLGLTLGDLFLSHPGCDDLKIGDFGLARRIEKRLMALYYGMPEYIAPEIINEEGVSYGTDMWSVGIITFILLSGISPFRGVNDRETLTKIKEGKWSFDERWTYISDDAKDFIRKLLEYQDHRRLDVKAALNHRWLTYADRTVTDYYKISSENLKNYYKTYREWYNNASCRTWYRRRKLSSAFEHPSKMVYPPGHRYTPEHSPERTFSPVKRPPPKSWESKIPSREPIDTEIGVIKSESHYQNGPDTYLLQLRDTDFPVRLREYMKVAHNRGFSRPVYDDNYDWGTPVIRERRRFTDIMDEEIDDERKARINQYSNVDTGTLRRLRHELGTRLDTYAEAEALMECKKGGHMPFFREKPQIRPIEDGKPAELACYAVGDPKPIIQWFRNDLVIQESNRVKITEDDEGRSILRFNPAKEHDIGIYKVVARNRIGQTVARTRVLVASVPCAPDSPEGVDASESEVLLRWKQPKYDGNSPVLCYNLQYKEGDSIDWKDVANNIDHEFFLVKNLKPNTSYQFRLSARNRIGWSEKGIPTKLLKTREGGLGVPKVQMTRAMVHLQELTESGQEIEIDDHKIHLDYTIEDEPINWTTDSQVTSKYSFMSELARGQFSVVAKGLDKSTDRVIVAKISEFTPKIEAEFEVLRSLRHEKIALLEAAYRTPKIAVFVMEKLQGADVLTYLSSRHEYTENCVATIITQILDALQYLHWRGYCHLDIQPDNVVMASVRSVQIKLVDLGSAHKVTKLGNLVPQVGHPEYRSPEVLNEEPAYPHSDIWMVGVLTYVLLSGASPFKGKDAHETKQNITFVRFRFEYLYKELSQEATRFLMLVFKRMPSKRPTAEECHEHRWLLPTEYMIKRRERAVFLGNRLKEYSEEYHAEKQKLATQSDSLKEAFGSSRQLMRSNSIQDELLTTI